MPCIVGNFGACNWVCNRACRSIKSFAIFSINGSNSDHCAGIEYISFSNNFLILFGNAANNIDFNVSSDIDKYLDGIISTFGIKSNDSI